MSGRGWAGLSWDFAMRTRPVRLAGVYHMAHDERGRAVQADFLFGR